MHRTLAVALTLLVVGCNSQHGGSPTDGSPSARLTSTLAPSIVDEPTGVTPLADVMKMAPGARVKTRAFLWMSFPHCPPCPPGADCELRPPPFYQFSERAHASSGSAPGDIILVDFAAPEPKLDVTTEYVLEGVVDRPGAAQPHLVLRVDKIAALGPGRDR
jgi:hypothetical protein